MTRYGGRFGPHITFLGVPPVDLDDGSASATIPPGTLLDGR